MGRRRVYGYCRVSGAEQGKRGTSLRAQAAEIRAYCKTHRLGRPDIRSEVVSGAAETRAGWQGILDAVSEGDTVLVCRVDRWSRDIVQAVQSVRDLVARGIRWVSIGDGIDATTAQGDSVLGIMSWTADQERRRIKERTVGRRRALRDEGRYVEGSEPLGYRRGPGQVLVVEPHGAAIVTGIYRRCIDGQSLREIQRWLRRRYPDEGRKWDRAPTHRMLRNRIYLGEVRTSRGEWIASHPAIISPQDFQRAQAALVSRRKGGRKPSRAARTATWVLRDVAVCAVCGAKMGAAYGAGGRDYYACTARLKDHRCDAPYVRVDWADRDASPLVVLRLEQLRDELRGTRPREPELDDWAGSRRRLEARRERLVDLAADGTITRDQLRRRLDRIAADLAAVADAEAEHGRIVAAQRPAVRRELLGSVEALRAAWARSGPRRRRAIVTRLAVAVAVAAGEDPEPRWRPVEQLVK